MQNLHTKKVLTLLCFDTSENSVNFYLVLFSVSIPMCVKRLNGFFRKFTDYVLNSSFSEIEFVANVKAIMRDHETTQL